MKILLNVAKCCVGILLVAGTVLLPLPVYATTTVQTVSGDGSFSGPYVGGAGTFANLNSDDGDTSYADMPEGNGDFEITDWAGTYSAINSVTLTAKLRNAVGSSVYKKLFVRIGATIYYESSLGGTYAAYTNFSKTWTVSPATGVVWTQAEINSARFGSYIQSSPAGLSCRNTYMTVTIDYTPQVAPSTTTVAASSIAPTSATLNGNITSDGGATITNYGFGWGTVSKTDPGNKAPTASAYAASWEVGAGSYGTGAITHATGATLTANTTYYFRAAAKNSVGWAWGTELSFKTIGIPVGTTQAATNVASTVARLNSNISDQNGQLCDIRFGYGTTTKATVAAYDVQTAWVNDIYATGSNPYVDITELAVSTPYFFRVAIRNDAGTLEGAELTFTTSSGVNEPTSITAIPSSTAINLSWVKDSANQTWIKYAEGAYPVTTGAGTLAYSGTGSSFELTGLTPGKTYYVSAWGLTSGVYSAAYKTVLSTTSAYSLPTTTPTSTNTTPITVTPSGIKLSSTPIVGNIVTQIAAARNIGEAYIWYFLWFIFGAGLYIILYNITHQDDIISGLVTIGWFGLGIAQELVGLIAMVIITIVWASTSIVGRNRV